ncbi:uncharacterized protein LOC126849640 isoform X2 [Cataglyphis hispanica]|uniref:uncharacterized protein LOC126849640 isoform X2 n=1 Tax=Cataglyphis hispanica TaxID=1086592 RepID=UPI00217F8E9C|nr:uncharacterized protein LOC126849640 isoform X2 [Cataglyphis hispanica]
MNSLILILYVLMWAVLIIANNNTLRLPNVNKAFTTTRLPTPPPTLTSTPKWYNGDLPFLNNDEEVSEERGSYNYDTNKMRTIKTYLPFLIYNLRIDSNQKYFHNTFMYFDNTLY